MADNGFTWFEGTSNDEGTTIYFNEKSMGKGTCCQIDYDNQKKQYIVKAEVFGPVTRLFIDYKHMLKVLKKNVKVNNGNE